MGSPDSTPPGERELQTEPIDTEEIDARWETEGSGLRNRRPRELMPTLHEDDPLRYDIAYDRKRDVTRDSMPTLTDIDPLRHDEPVADSETADPRSDRTGT